MTRSSLDVWAPDDFLAASDKEIAATTGSCGPDGVGDAIVPDTLYGLDVTPACRVHDWQYGTGTKWKDKDDADRTFLSNMLLLVEKAGGPPWLKWLRRKRAWVYYRAVTKFGGPAFWRGK